MNKIAVFCGSSETANPEFLAMGRKIGSVLGVKSGLIYGGGTTGIMGAVAEGFRDVKAHITTVTVPRFHKEGWEKLVDEFICVDSIEERKRIMFDLAYGYLILPGSWGTLDEVSSIIMEAQYGVHNKKIVFWSDFFKPILDINAKMVEHNLARHDDLHDKIHFADDLDHIVKHFHGDD